MTFQLIYWGTYTWVYPYIYLFISIFLFRLTTKTYLSPQLLLYLPMDVPIQNPTCLYFYAN